MSPVELLILTGYVLAAFTLSVYGLHRLWLVAGLRRRDIRPLVEDPAAWPRVTVQVPMFNEHRIAEGIIDAVCDFEYPPDRLQIQVLDDSTDHSAAIARDRVQHHAARGVDIEYRHRTDRSGYKAGALAAGLETATGEFIAIFDADFRPDPDWLCQVVPPLTADDRAGLVQSRWTHANRDASWLTQIQAIALDAHFAVEQAVRCRRGDWFNFNGTAGIWRRTCIDDAGGWAGDTLTEDTDLSYRAQMRGWRFLFLPDVTCPADVPVSMTAFVGQQHRWTRGLTQNARRFAWPILRSRVSWRTRLEALFHLTSPLPYPAILLLASVAVPAMYVSLPVYEIPPVLALTVGLGCLLFGTIAVSVFYLAGQRLLRRSLLASAIRLPLLMAVGVGLSVSNTGAMLGGLRRRSSPFVRTPKPDGGRETSTDPVAASGPVRRLRWPAGLIEIALAGLMVASIVWSIGRPYVLVGAPFLVLFGWGFAMVGVPRLQASLARGLLTPRTTPRPADPAQT